MRCWKYLDHGHNILWGCKMALHIAVRVTSVPVELGVARRLVRMNAAGFSIGLGEHMGGMHWAMGQPLSLCRRFSDATGMPVSLTGAKGDHGACWW